MVISFVGGVLHYPTLPFVWWGEGAFGIYLVMGNQGTASHIIKMLFH